MISAIILSAGSSSRMGKHKALTTIGEKTFLRHIVDVLHSSQITDIVLVLGYDHQNIRQQISWFDGKIAVNDNWQRGQLSSILSGLPLLDQKNLHGVIICPIDHPLISQSLIVDLLQAFWKSKKKIILPKYKDRRGHPVIFSRELFEELQMASPDTGAREVVHRHVTDIYEMETGEEGVVNNIDTPEDYQHLILREQ